MSRSDRPATGFGPLHRWGSASWAVVGIALLAALLFSMVSALSGLVVPLILAIVIGTLGVPVVDWLERRRLPRPAGAAVFLLALTATLVLSVALVVRGVIDQSGEISDQVTAGMDLIDGWLEDLDVDLGSADSGLNQAEDAVGNLIPGVASLVPAVFSGAVSFLIGSFVGLFLLYYILVDWTALRNWLSRHIGVRDDVGAGILDDSTSILRQGFYALSLSSLVTAVLIGITMVVLGVPLAFTVALVTFVTSYIPYLGAIISGAFAFLVALGAEGVEAAIILLIVILVVQNLVQTVVQTKMTSDRLALHPIASLASTIIGAALAGLLGATLSAPVLAMLIAIKRRVEAIEDLDVIAETETETETEIAAGDQAG